MRFGERRAGTQGGGTQGGLSNRTRRVKGNGKRRGSHCPRHFSGYLLDAHPGKRLTDLACQGIASGQAGQANGHGASTFGLQQAGSKQRGTGDAADQGIAVLHDAQLNRVLRGHTGVVRLPQVELSGRGMRDIIDSHDALLAYQPGDVRTDALFILGG